jgi:DNA (cytosine-5)-methyltransferase 1
MVNYSCETCQKVFSQKGHFEAHKRRKTPCKKDNTIEALVEQKVQEALSKTNMGTPRQQSSMDCQQRKIRYIDLFCGLGAFHEAFNTNSAFECVLACDIDAGVRKLYKANYGIDVEGDIRKIDPTCIPDFDIVCAGFPCQPFSIAGNGEGFNDTEKGNLFYDILNIIDAKHPRMCILENVKNLKTHDNGNTYKTIQDELTKRGYSVTSSVLNAANFGSPQARQRIFIVATLGKPFSIPSSNNTVRPVSSIIDKKYTADTINRDKYLIEPTKSQTTNIASPKIVANIVDKKTKKGGRQGERVYDISHVGITVCASSGGPGAKTGLYRVGDSIRRLNVTETLGMFGFPITYNFCDIGSENSLFYLGNSIVVDVVKTFVSPVLAWFENTVV